VTSEGKVTGVRAGRQMLGLSGYAGPAGHWACRAAAIPSGRLFSAVSHFGRRGEAPRSGRGRTALASVEAEVARGLGPGSGGGWITLAALRVDQFGRPLTPCSVIPKVRPVSGVLTRGDPAWLTGH
jgi:hypothetical protein